MEGRLAGWEGREEGKEGREEVRTYDAVAEDTARDLVGELNLDGAAVAGSVVRCRHGWCGCCCCGGRWLVRKERVVGKRIEDGGRDGTSSSSGEVDHARSERG